MTTMTMQKPQKDVELRPKNEQRNVETTRPGRVFSPSVDIYETAEAITLVADMPGVRTEGLDIDLRDNILTIDGRVETRLGEGERLLLHEYDTGSYRKELRLTELIDRDRIEASLQDGVLRLTLPKAERARPRKIEVSGA